MNAQQIADRLVERGIGWFDSGTGKYYAPGTPARLAAVSILRRMSAANRARTSVYSDFMTAEQFISDWRTAGACLERLEGYDGFVLTQSGDDAGGTWVKLLEQSGILIGQSIGLGGVLSLPAAICAAFAEVEI